MRRYETIIITDPDLSGEEREQLFERLKDLILQHEGFLVILDEWGTKKLAYEIKKKVRGHYVRFDYCGTEILVNEIERLSRIDDRILKYMTVLLEKNVDIEKIKEGVVQAETEQTASDHIAPVPDDSDDSDDSDMDTDQITSGQTESDQTESGQAESDQIESDTNRSESGKNETASIESNEE